MARTVTVNSTSYSIPDTGEDGWGTALSNYLEALGTVGIFTGGGVRTLTADLDFGATYGVLAPYYKSKSANISSAGVLRLGNNQSVAWRNAANSDNIVFKVDASDEWDFNGTPISAAELGYLVGVTSAIQTQLDAKVALTGDQTIAGAKTFSSTIVGSVNGNAGTVTGGVYLSGAQTITGIKTFDEELILKANDTPATPSAGYLSLYMKSDVPHYIDSAGAEKTIANTADSFANPMTTLGDVVYGGASGTATRIAGNTTVTPKFLVQTGDGSVSAAPSWETTLATATTAGLLPAYATGSWTPTLGAGTRVNNTGDVTFVGGRHTRIGNRVFVTLDSITGIRVTNVGADTRFFIQGSALPGVVNATRFGGTANIVLADTNRSLVASVASPSDSNTDISIRFAVPAGSDPVGLVDSGFSEIVFSYTIA